MKAETEEFIKEYGEEFFETFFHCIYGDESNDRVEVIVSYNTGLNLAVIL